MKKFYRDNWKNFLWLLLGGFAMTLFWVTPWSRPPIVYIKVGCFTTTMCIPLWLGNSYASQLVSTRISWMKEPVKRVVVGIVVMFAYSLIAMFAIILFYEFVFGMRFMDDIESIMWSSLTVTVIISLFMHGRAFLQSWRAAELNSAQLQKESMQAQFDSLRSQVNPHFLFNSLNALTNLIYDDPDKAARFVKQLSEVYRYVLDTQGKEVVPLDDEVKFLKSYLFLQQIRFGDKLKVDLDLNASNVQIAPLVLQMLVENAIKHNIVSTEQPLTIKIFRDATGIVVQNNIQKKMVLPEDSKGIGLENIKKRYSFLAQNKVEVRDDNKSFIVKLPVL